MFDTHPLQLGRKPAPFGASLRTVGARAVDPREVSKLDVLGHDERPGLDGIAAGSLGILLQGDVEFVTWGNGLLANRQAVSVHHLGRRLPPYISLRTAAGETIAVGAIREAHGDFSRHDSRAAPGTILLSSTGGRAN